MRYIGIILLLMIWTGFEGNAGEGIPDAEGIGTKDIWKIEDAYPAIDDLSYDEEQGYYCIIVICGFRLAPVMGDGQSISINKPEGSRKIPFSERYTWNIYGHSGLLFEISCNADKFSNESDDVYLVGSAWLYGSDDIYSDIEEGNNGLNLSDNDNFYSCNGFGQIIFLPKQIVAGEMANKSLYTFDMNINVDFLAWALPL